MAAIALILTVGLAVRFRPVWGLLIVAAIMVPLERLFRRHDYPILRPGVRTDIVHFLFTHFLELGCLLAAAGITYVVLSPFEIEPAEHMIASLPFIGQALVTTLLFSVGYYWEHRLAHEWGFLWRFHSVHHSSERLDWLAAAHLHPFEAFIGGFVIAPAFVLLGVHPATIAVLSSIQTGWAIPNHANVNWRMRWMDRIWPNPEYHHWHHSNEADARNHNYGFPALDTIFGTYFMPKDRSPQEYGIDEPMPETYLGQLAQPFRREPAAQPMRMSSSRVPSGSVQ